MKHFQASENGHFSYKDPSGFAHPFLRVPSNEAAVIAIWEKWSEKKNEQIERHFHKANYKIPPLFGGNLQLRSIEPVFAPLDTSSITTALDSQYPQYWKLFFQIELPALELKRSSKLWQDLKEGGKTLADYMEILRPEALETILKLTKKTVVQGESVTVYIGKQQDIIQMEYQHLPVLDRQPTDLLVPVNLRAEGIFRTPHSGTQAVEDSKLAGISMLHRRHSETQEVTPFWNGGGAASGRGSEGEDTMPYQIIAGEKKACYEVLYKIETEIDVPNSEPATKEKWTYYFIQVTAYAKNKYPEPKQDFSNILSSLSCLVQMLLNGMPNSCNLTLNLDSNSIIYEKTTSEYLPNSATLPEGHIFKKKMFEWSVDEANKTKYCFNVILLEIADDILYPVSDEDIPKEYCYIAFNKKGTDIGGNANTRANEKYLGKGGYIDYFAYVDDAKSIRLKSDMLALARTLAHELLHAVGISHIWTKSDNNPLYPMFYKVIDSCLFWGLTTELALKKAKGQPEYLILYNNIMGSGEIYDEAERALTVTEDNERITRAELYKIFYNINGGKQMLNSQKQRVLVNISSK